MLYALIARDKPGSADARAEHRPVHLEFLKSLGEKLVFAGALMGADGKPEGSLCILQADSLEDATAKFNADPFVKTVFASVEVKPWRIAINHTGREY